MSERKPFPGINAVPEHRRTVRLVENTQSRRFMGRVMDAMIKRDAAHQMESVTTASVEPGMYIPAAQEQVDSTQFTPVAEEIARRRAIQAAQELASRN
jgi:hypothetical protein